MGIEGNWSSHGCDEEVKREEYNPEILEFHNAIDVNIYQTFLQLVV